jgi:hypothetical protein
MDCGRAAQINRFPDFPHTGRIFVLSGVPLYKVHNLLLFNRCFFHTGHSLPYLLAVKYNTYFYKMQTFVLIFLKFYFPHKTPAAGRPIAPAAGRPIAGVLLCCIAV